MVSVGYGRVFTAHRQFRFRRCFGGTLLTSFGVTGDRGTEASTKRVRWVNEALVLPGYRSQNLSKLFTGRHVVRTCVVGHHVRTGSISAPGTFER